MMMMMMPWSLTTSTIGGEKNWFKWGNRDLNKIHSNLLFRLKSAWQHSNSKGKKQIRSWVNFNGHHVHPKRKTSHHQKKTASKPFFEGRFLVYPQKKRKDLLLTTFIKLVSNHLTSLQTTSSIRMSHTSTARSKARLTSKIAGNEFFLFPMVS